MRARGSSDVPATESGADGASARHSGGAGDRTERWLVIAAGILIAAVVLLRFATLDLQSFAHDESVTVTRILGDGFVETLAAVVGGERSGPVYYLVAWGWSQVFGLGEVGLRSLSALLGTLVIPVAYLVGRELGSRRAALLGAVLVAINPFLFWYSQEARSYTLFVLLGAVALLFFVRALRHGGRRDLVWWAVASVIGLATHYFAAFLIAPQGLWLLLRRRAERRTWVAVGAVALISLALLALALLQQGDRVSGFESRPLALRVLQAGVLLLSGGAPQLGATIDAVQLGTVSLVIAVVTALVMALAVVLLARRGDARQRHGGALLGSLAGFALLFPIALAVVGPDLIKHRNLIGGLLPLLLLAALGLGARKAGKSGLAAAGALVVLSGVGLIGQVVDPELQRRDVRAIVEALPAPAGPRVVLGPEGDDDPLLLYAGSDARKVVRPCGVFLVREIVVINEEPPLPPPPQPGFAPIDRGAAGGYEFALYRADGAREISLASLPVEREPEFVIPVAVDAPSRGGGPIGQRQADC
jgi:mannosyltransferase